MLPALLCVVLLVSVTAGCSDQDNRPLVATREGLVRGVLARSAAGHLFYSFKGIPYARPPLGSLRFQPPQRHPGWTGVVQAIEHGNKCTQLLACGTEYPKVVDGAEDCLFTNVYTPQLPALKGAMGGLPVMVFIHGGSFMCGSGNDDRYGPNYLMDGGVVLVTFNYRLGLLGFFSTHDSNAPGNYGLLDQVLLLQWVQDNIGSFGGATNTVTIFGQSAGGASVSLLVLSPLTRGLFQHAVSQSGASASTFAVNGRRKGSAEELAMLLNCSSIASLKSCSSCNIEEVVDCIRQVPSDVLFEALKEEVHMFNPRVDREAAYPLLPDDPRSLLERGDFNLVPWMNGITEEEGSLFLPFWSRRPTIMSSLMDGDLSIWGDLVDFDKSLRIILECGASFTEELTKVHDFYSSNGSVSYDNLLPIARVLADRIWVAPMAEEVRLASHHTPVYKYVLDYRGPGHLFFGELIGHPDMDLGATHGDDLMYLFSNAKLPLAPHGSPTYTMIRFMVSLWTSFARTGRPSSDVLAMPDWPIFTEQSQRHMHLNLEPALGERLFEERVSFWQTVRINEPWRHAVQTACEEAP